MNLIEMCVCGHIVEEHGPSGECDAEGCRCAFFEVEGEEEMDEEPRV